MTIFGILIFVVFVTIMIAITRWVFLINEQIELLSQIRDELKKLNLKG